MLIKKKENPSAFMLLFWYSLVVGAGASGVSQLYHFAPTEAQWLWFQSNTKHCTRRDLKVIPVG